MSNRDGAVQDACAPTGNEVAAAKCDYLLEQPSGKWGADTRVEDSEPPPIHLQLVDGVRANLTAQVLDDLSSMLLGEAGNHVLEEADDSMSGHIAGLDEALWLKDTLWRRIELEDRVVTSCVLVGHLGVTSSAPIVTSVP